MTKYKCSFCDKIFEFEHKGFSVEMPNCPDCEDSSDVSEDPEDA